jgi:hypothetical protein
MKGKGRSGKKMSERVVMFEGEVVPFDVRHP